MRALLIIIFITFSSSAIASPPKKGVKSKFYDFGAQMIDGNIRQPQSLFVSPRQKAKFDRLLRLKKSFLPKLFQTSKEKVFK